MGDAGAEKGKEIHESIVYTVGSSVDEIKLSNALIDFYGESKDVESALKIFEQMDDTKKIRFA